MNKWIYLILVICFLIFLSVKVFPSWWKETLKPYTFWQMITGVGNLIIMSYLAYHETKRFLEKKNKKIIKEILQPEKEEIKFLIGKLRECAIDPPLKWDQFQKENRIFEIPVPLRTQIAQLANNLKIKYYLAEEKRKKLKLLIQGIIKEILLKTIPERKEFKELKERIEALGNIQINPDIACYVVNLSYKVPLEGITFFNLVFENKTFKYLRKEIIKSFSAKGISEEDITRKEEFRLVIENVYIKDITQLVSGKNLYINGIPYEVPINEELLDSVSQIILKRVKEDKELLEFVNDCRSLYKEAVDALEKMEIFIKENME
jgi:hypothetical protein